MVILLVTIGGGTMSTKHMHMQMNLVLEAVAKKRIEAEYVHTSKTKADAFTTPSE